MLTRRHTLRLAAFAPLALSLSPRALAQSQAAFYSEGGLALGGTDPVAYFTDAMPVVGSAEFSHDWGDTTWRFASAENRDRFVEAPEAYAPQYGGYCAWAAARGYLAPTVPEAWSVVEDKLYLNASKRIQRRWERDIPGFIAQADANWPGLLDG